MALFVLKPLRARHFVRNHSRLAPPPLTADVGRGQATKA
jgi:hypothetical protein